jgi:HK97 family phage portal protein
VWAAIRLRANLISTFPVDVFRTIMGVDVEMTKPPILVNPGGDRVDIAEWLYSSQVDLDRGGNVFGLITERNGAGLPQRIDLQPLAKCSVVQRPGQPLKYAIDGKEYPAEQVWHERACTVSGLPVGLSPVAYAAWSIGQYESAQQFAVDWYGSGGMAKAHLKNTEVPNLDQKVADAAKSRFKAAVEGRDLFVTGSDWEYTPIQAEAVGMDWLEAQRYGIGDIARFFDVPGDLIGAPTQGMSIKYANVTQHNLQFLVMHLGPAVVRRERALSNLLPAPRFVKFNTDALLRMDPSQRAAVIATQINSRTLTPTEARRLDNREPYTPAQVDEFTSLFGAPSATADAGVVPAPMDSGGSA